MHFRELMLVQRWAEPVPVLGRLRGGETERAELVAFVSGPAFSRPGSSADGVVLFLGLERAAALEQPALCLTGWFHVGFSLFKSCAAIVLSGLLPHLVEHALLESVKGGGFAVLVVVDSREGGFLVVHPSMGRDTCPIC